MSGKASPKFPDDLSAKYALCCALAMRAKSTTQIKNSLVYLANNSSSEWLNQCTIDIYSILKEKGKGNELIEVLSKNEKLLDASKDNCQTTSSIMNFQDLVAKSIIQIKESNEFFGALMLFSEFKLSKEIPTAATNGKDVLINEGFFNSLSSSEQNGLILHEVLHMALLHVQRMGGRDLKKWNIAADYVVNDLILRNTNFKLPTGAIKSSHGEYWDKSVEFIYDKLGSKDTKSFTQYDLIESDSETKGATKTMKLKIIGKIK